MTDNESALEALKSDIDKIKREDGRPLHSIHVMSDSMMANVCQGSIRPQPIPGTGDDLIIVICKSTIDAAMKSAELPMILPADGAPEELFGHKVLNSLPYDPVIWRDKMRRQGCDMEALGEALRSILASSTKPPTPHTTSPTTPDPAR